ncbi:MAG TPA: KEOPS complex N(6)-L-threonylcarbamoyladenine synthase Kae1 [Candidatus Nanoarchaeia archaeon]|nr:KEOPS complex N(6)-L-threonylcarbamoyladenine synthase Kae1 [Candidatus Nanoarchaeia archaeon]
MKNRKKIVLGIESTAHTFGIGIISYNEEKNNTEILANVKDMYTTQTGGIIPMDSAKHHKEVSWDVYYKALNQAGINEEDIDLISFSQAPGLPPCLIEGMKFSKELSKKLNITLVPVNHCIAHLEIGDLFNAKDPVMLYASGANTQIIAYASGKYRVFGETLDTGVGNFIDNFARYLDVGFPGGPKVEKVAQKSNNLIELPYRVKGMDVSFAGILTNLKQKFDSGKYKKEDLAYSMQETVFAMLVETAERALAHTGKKELLLGGGVGCNSRLQDMCKKMCKNRDFKLGEVKFYSPDKNLLVDNGVMIAYLGLKMNKSGIGYHPKKDSREFKEIDIKPRQRTDEVEVSWR